MKNPAKTLLLRMALLALPAVGLMACSNDDDPAPVTSVAEEYSGTYAGTITLNVADRYSYQTEIECTVTEVDDKTVAIAFPEYSLAGTMMGDMTLGGVTITDVAYDEAKGGFYRSYGGEGITQTMNGNTYPLNDPSSILAVRNEDGSLTVENPFTLGKMPLPLTATFEGRKSDR